MLEPSVGNEKGMQSGDHVGGGKRLQKSARRFVGDNRMGGGIVEELGEGERRDHMSGLPQNEQQDKGGTINVHEDLRC